MLHVYLLKRQVTLSLVCIIHCITVTTFSWLVLFLFCKVLLLFLFSNFKCQKNKNKSKPSGDIKRWLQWVHEWRPLWSTARSQGVSTLQRRQTRVSRKRHQTSSLIQTQRENISKDIFLHVFCKYKKPKWCQEKTKKKPCFFGGGGVCFFSQQLL